MTINININDKTDFASNPRIKNLKMDISITPASWHMRIQNFQIGDLDNSAHKSGCMHARDDTTFVPVRSMSHG